MTPFVVSMFAVWALQTPKDSFHQPLSAPDGATQERSAVTPPVVVLSLIHISEPTRPY